VILLDDVVIGHAFPRHHRRGGIISSPAVSWADRDRGVGST
jgi:hypothetical protein